MEHAKDKQSELTESKKLALHYMKTLIDVAQESFLILGADLKVLSANPTFYQAFQVSPEDTEGKPVYALGNGQWDIPELRNLMGSILPKKKIITNYEVTHVFETVGKKTMLLSARQIDAVQLIILAIEDITTRKELENKLAENAQELEIRVAKRTAELDDRVKDLETLNKTMVGRELKMIELKKEVDDLKKLVRNGNGNHNGHKE
jgi:PAS domain-containing protein